MKEHLKAVQDIFPETYYEHGSVFETPKIVVPDIGFLIKKYSNSFYIVDLNFRGICRTKDFSKILAVLKAIKECE